MRPLLLPILLFPLFCAAQSGLSFEVASVKLAGPQSRRNFDGGPGSRNPERYKASAARLSDLLYTAYGLVDVQQLVGPGWIESELYDVSAKVPAAATKEQFQKMLQNLLVERFHLKIHMETKSFPVYELTVVRNGPKFKVSSPANADPAEPRVGDVDRDGFPKLPPGVATAAMRNTPDRSQLVAQRQPLSTLVTMLRSAAQRPIIDKTGLAGIYDYKLEFLDPRMKPSETTPAPDLFGALQDQLGLRLVDTKAQFEVVVVDDGNKVPTEN